jgi:hypothetical protein
VIYYHESEHASGDNGLLGKQATEVTGKKLAEIFDFKCVK